MRTLVKQLEGCKCIDLAEVRSASILSA